MTETKTGAGAAPLGAEADPLLFADEVAALVTELARADDPDANGIDTRTVIFYASQSRRRTRAGTMTPYDLPVPQDGDYTLRAVDTKVPGVQRSIRSPRWRRSVVVAWREAMTERPPPERERDQDTGKYLRAG